MYTIINEKIEKSSKLLHWAAMYVGLPIGLLPPIISVYVNYYYFGLGDDSFIMPCPMMYVLNIHIFTYIQRKFLTYTLLIFKIIIGLEDAAWLSTGLS